MAENVKSESMEFQTEAKQLLHLVIHSLYSHKEVFLRELISNASDALDKLRFESLTTPDILPADTELKIRLVPNKENNTLTLIDNGIGMSKEELINNIGTIARSGSKAFFEKLTGDQKADSNLIGQFGVGFYSVFMVASKVELTTKRAGSDEPAFTWESTGENNFTLTEADKTEPGTEIVIYLKEDEKEFLDEWKLKSLVKKYSDYIAFPIYLPELPAPAEDEKEDSNEVKVPVDKVINATKPIWKRKASDVTDEQYEEFYKSACGGFDKPIATIHNNAEGIMEYSSLLFVPSNLSPFEMYNNERKHGVKLYVKRVFITDDCKELIPEYLRFVKGVVDSEDLPLNVSRETLQADAIIKRINKALTKKIFGKLNALAEDDYDTFKKFWKDFGPIIKEGLHSDFENKDSLLELCRFQSSNGDSEDDLTTLKQYVSRMREEQKDIYYITGESRAIVEKSPHLEIFREKGIEVLYLVDPIDEFIVPNLGPFEGKQLVSVTKGDLDLGDLGKEEKKAQKKTEKEYKGLVEKIKNVLGDDVKDVRVTTRLKDSPCCLVADANDMGAHMEKLMKSMGQDVPASKRILEINGTHVIFQNIKTVFEKDSEDARLDDWVRLLYDQAIIAEGQLLQNPTDFLKRVNDLLSSASGSAVA